MELSTQQRANIIEEIADHVVTMTKITRFRYESVDGYGLLDFWHRKSDYDHIPTWQRSTCTLGPLSIPEWKEYTQSVTSEVALPEVDEKEPFLLQHSDLNALNIMVHPDGKNLTIIDWEVVGFFPSYRVTSVCMAYRMENVPKEEEMEYKDGLKAALVRRGFRDHEEEFKVWLKAAWGRK